LWRLKSIQYGSRKKAAEIVVERYEHRAEKKGQLKDQIPRLEVCQVMLEHPDDEPQFSFADADFSRSTFRDLRSQGFKDMIEAIHYPERVTHDQQGHLLRHHYATLYRHGSEGKWKVPRVQHQHRGSNHRDLPSALKLWKSWCEQFA
jgi:hypothetical protein